MVDFQNSTESYEMKGALSEFIVSLHFTAY